MERILKRFFFQNIRFDHALFSLVLYKRATPISRVRSRWTLGESFRENKKKSQENELKPYIIPEQRAKPDSSSIKKKPKETFQKKNQSGAIHDQRLLLWLSFSQLPPPPLFRPKMVVVVGWSVYIPPFQKKKFCCFGFRVLRWRKSNLISGRKCSYVSAVCGYISIIIISKKKIQSKNFI